MDSSLTVTGASGALKSSQLWIDRAENELGVKRGTNTDRIVKYWSDFRMSGIKNDKVSWCSAFIGAMLESVGINTNSNDSNIYKKRTKDSSQYWLYWDKGHAVEPCYGCIAVMTRSGGGHVGFLIGEDGDNWVLLGGNQGSAVSIAKFPKSRFVGFIMPNGYNSDLPIPNLRANREDKLS